MFKHYGAETSTFFQGIRAKSAELLEQINPFAVLSSLHEAAGEKIARAKEFWISGYTVGDRVLVDYGGDGDVQYSITEVHKDEKGDIYYSLQRVRGQNQRAQSILCLYHNGIKRKVS